MAKIIENVREQLLTEAKKQIWERGYADTTIRSVAGGRRPWRRVREARFVAWRKVKICHQQGGFCPYIVVGIYVIMNVTEMKRG